MRCVFGKQEYAAAGVEVAPKKVKWRLVRMAGLHVVSQGKPRWRYALAAKQPSSQAGKQASRQAGLSLFVCRISARAQVLFDEAVA